MERFFIDYKNQTWPAIEITIFQNTPEQMDVVVATTDLEDAILEDIERTDSLGRQATNLDDEIAYYVEPFEINLSEEEIIKIVESSYL